MKVRPLGNRVVIKIKNEKERKVGGIVLPETAKEIPNQGEVIAVGPGTYRGDVLVPLDVEVGDNVVYMRHAGTGIELDEEGDYIVISQDNILAVLE